MHGILLYKVPFSLVAVFETFLNQKTTIISMIMRGFSRCIDYNLIS